MNIALVGTGRMGQAVEALAGERGHEIVARFNASNPLLEADTVAALNGADVVIDFSLPDLGAAHIERYCAWNRPAVIGTTGWYDALDRVRAWVAEREAAVLYAPNFSLGVALLARALHGLVPLLEHLPEYDVALHEAHHTGKVDSPSGTALLLADVLLDGLSRKTRLDAETQHRRIDPEALHVTSTRLGHVVGMHTVYLDSPFDEITLAHQAKNRQGFAFGALKAAEWLPGRQGLFTLDDLLADWLPEA
ncbi:MAG: 4-hydroxy-tetrahydrodipicolinate reductase [Rhodothermales bacterium]